METINQKVDHLNKLTMIAMTSKDAYMFRANQEVCEFINALKSEGYNISEGDEFDIYTDYEMRVIDRLTALISQSMAADEVIRYGMADDGEELELDQFYSYMSDSEIGLLECREKNPEGIRFFYLDGDDGQQPIIIGSFFFLENIFHLVGGGLDASFENDRKNWPTL